MRACADRLRVSLSVPCLAWIVFAGWAGAAAAVGI